MGILQNISDSPEELSTNRKIAAGGILGALSQVAATRYLLIPQSDSMLHEAAAWGISAGIGLLPVKTDVYVPFIALGGTIGMAIPSVYQITQNRIDHEKQLQGQADVQQINRLDTLSLQRYHEVVKPKGLLDRLDYKTNARRRNRHEYVTQKLSTDLLIE